MDSIINSVQKIIEEYGEDLLMERSVGTITLYRSDLVDDLVGNLSDREEFSCFNEKYQLFFNGATRVNLKMLIVWLVRRAIKTSPANAVQNVIDYINSEEINAYQIMLLSNMIVTREYEFINGISLVPIHLVPDEDIRNSILELNEGILSLPRVTCALIRKVPFRKCHYENEEDFYSTRLYFNEFEDVRYCFSILDPPGRGLQSVGTSIITSRDVPLLNGIAWNLSDLRRPPIGPTLIEINANRVIRFYKLFCGLENEDKKSKIRVALKLISNYESTYDYVEKSMYLRSVLESLFINKQVSYIKRVLSDRVSKEFARTPVEKEEISNLIKMVYKITSEAIHRGSLSDEYLEIAYNQYPIALKYALLKIGSIVSSN